MSVFSEGRNMQDNPKANYYSSDKAREDWLEAGLWNRLSEYVG